MTHDNTESQPKRYTLRPTFTPLPHNKETHNQPCSSNSGIGVAPSSAQTAQRQTDNSKNQHKGNSSQQTSNTAHQHRNNGAYQQARHAAYSRTSTTNNKHNSLIRAANEDDDLYDPYSDFHDGTLRAAEFEEDPWH